MEDQEYNVKSTRSRLTFYSPHSATCKASSRRLQHRGAGAQRWPWTPRAWICTQRCGASLGSAPQTRATAHAGIDEDKAPALAMEFSTTCEHQPPRSRYWQRAAIGGHDMAVGRKAFECTPQCEAAARKDPDQPEMPTAIAGYSVTTSPMMMAREGHGSDCRSSGSRVWGQVPQRLRRARGSRGSCGAR